MRYLVLFYICMSILQGTYVWECHTKKEEKDVWSLIGTTIGSLLWPMAAIKAFMNKYNH